MILGKSDIWLAGDLLSTNDFCFVGFLSVAYDEAKQRLGPKHLRDEKVILRNLALSGQQIFKITSYRLHSVHSLRILLTIIQTETPASPLTNDRCHTPIGLSSSTYYPFTTRSLSQILHIMSKAPFLLLNSQENKIGKKWKKQWAIYHCTSRYLGILLFLFLSNFVQIERQYTR